MSALNELGPDVPRKSQAMQDFENLIERLANEATPADREYISDLINPEGTVKIADLTPAQAAVLFGIAGGELQPLCVSQPARLLAGVLGTVERMEAMNLGPRPRSVGILRWLRVAERWEFLCASF